MKTMIERASEIVAAFGSAEGATEYKSSEWVVAAVADKANEFALKMERKVDACDSCDYSAAWCDEYEAGVWRVAVQFRVQWADGEVETRIYDWFLKENGRVFFEGVDNSTRYYDAYGRSQLEMLDYYFNLGVRDLLDFAVHC